jgi:hypothetical protein
VLVGAVGEKRPLAVTAWSLRSRELRPADTFGTSSVWRCFSCGGAPAGNEAEPETEGVFDEDEGGYGAGDENRCGEVVAARAGTSCVGVGVEGTRELVYVRGPVLCGLLEIGAGTEIFRASFATGLGDSMGGCDTMFPWVDATEFLSVCGGLASPFCELVLFLASSAPLMERELPLREDRWSQLLPLDRPLGMEVRLVS